MDEEDALILFVPLDPPRFALEYGCRRVESRDRARRNVLSLEAAEYLFLSLEPLSIVVVVLQVNSELGPHEHHDADKDRHDRDGGDQEEAGCPRWLLYLCGRRQEQADKEDQTRDHDSQQLDRLSHFARIELCSRHHVPPGHLTTIRLHRRHLPPGCLHTAVDANISI